MAIDTNEAKGLFSGLKKTEKPYIPVKKDVQVIELPLKKESPQSIQDDTKENDQYDLKMPKWKTLEKVNVLLTAEQKEGLDRVAKKIMKIRSKEVKGEDRERITANTLIRALVDNFLEIEKTAQHEIITSESALYEWVKKTLSK